MARLRKEYNQLKTAVRTLAPAIPYGEIGEKLGEELYNFLLEDSKVPGMVIGGMKRFIDLKKYLRIAGEKGAEEAGKHAETTLREVMKE